MLLPLPLQYTILDSMLLYICIFKWVLQVGFSALTVSDKGILILTCWSATKSKCLFYLTKFQIKPFQPSLCYKNAAACVNKEKSTCLTYSTSAILRVRAVGITNNTKGEIMNTLEKRRWLLLRATCINDTANLTNGSAEYNNASASKWPFNYANRRCDARPAIIKLLNSCQTRSLLPFVTFLFRSFVGAGPSNKTSPSPPSTWWNDQRSY